MTMFSASRPAQTTKVLLQPKKCLFKRSNSIFVSSKTRTMATNTNTIDLDFQLYTPSHEYADNGPLLILHGLFGSKRNWNTLAQAFTTSLERPVYALDLRNQGTSPHVKGMSYRDMAQDVLEFMDKHSLARTTVLGHSMGGKVAMAVALDPYLDQHKDLVENLIVADIAPVKAKISSQFQDYVKAMKEIENRGMKTRKEASDFLETYAPEPSIRAFLLTNLAPTTPEQPYIKFRVPLDIIGDAIPEIGDFPYAEGDRIWEGRSLFVKGSKSPYINRHGIPLIESFFPRHNLEVLDTGHWVHAERPKEFQQLVIDFLNNRNN